MKNMKGFKNVNVYVEGKGIVKTTIGFENGVITALDNNALVEELGSLNEDMVVVPGFIDQHRLLSYSAGLAGQNMTYNYNTKC